MCGIAGAVSKRTSPSERRAREALVEQMAQAVAHRGPDGGRTWSDEACSLGFRHLSFFAGGTSMQPLRNEDGTLYLVCNGEIFNYPDLKKTFLRAGHIFQTPSDCEVILHLYEERGVDFFDELDGQFAFALWDRRKERLMLARDKFGICPLYYRITPRYCAFGSEIKAVLRDPSSNAKLHVENMAQTALFYGSLSPGSCFEGVFQVPPASCVIFTKHAWKKTVHTYWNFLDHIVLHDRTSVSHSRLEKKLLHALSASVVKRTHGDHVPGVYLSGGLDSAAIAALLRSTHSNATAFSLQFDDEAFDESSFQTMVTKHLDIRHEVVQVTKSQIIKNLPLCLWHTESPLSRSAPIPMMLLSRYVRQAGFQTVLTGEGADELFAGYPVFSRGRASVNAKYTKNKEILSFFVNAHALTAKMDAIVQQFWNVYAGKASYALAGMQSVEIQTKLSQFLLSTQGDRVSLANGIEARYPFLSEDILRLLPQVPPKFLQHDGFGKYILRRAISPMLPDAIVWRSKQGYLAPEQEFLEENASARMLRETFLSDRAIRSTGYFSLSKIKNLKKILPLAKTDPAIQSQYLFVVSVQILDALLVKRDTTILSL